MYLILSQKAIDQDEQRVLECILFYSLPSDLRADLKGLPLHQAYHLKA